MSKSSYRGFVLALVLASALISCAKPAIKIGMTAVLTGGTSELGIAIRNGAMIAIDDLAESGVRVELTVRDDKADLEEGTRQVTALAKSGYSMIMGHLTSSATLASLPSANDLDIILLSPTANASALFGLDDALFLLMPSAREMASAAAEYSVKKLGLSRAALVGDVVNESFTDSYTDGFRQRFTEAGGKVVYEVKLPKEKSGIMREIAKAIVGSDPDCVVLTTDINDTSLLAQQLRLVGFTGTLVGSDGSMDAALATNGGDAVQGMLFPALYSQGEPSARMKAFNAKYSNRFGATPSDIAKLGWEALTILAKAADGGTGSERVRARLLSGRFDILEGSVTFNATGEAMRPIALLELRGKDFVPAP